MTRQEKISSLLGDVGIPILGFFFWNWSIYFICLFFLLDQVSKEVSGIIRIYSLRQRVKFSNRIYFIHALSFILCLLAVHCYVYMLHPKINFLIELSNFFWFKDMGIAQGFVLIPMVFISERFRYQMNTKHFTDEMHVQHWYFHTIQLSAYFILFLSMIILLTYIEMSEMVSFLILLCGFVVIALFTHKLRPFFPRLFP